MLRQLFAKKLREYRRVHDRSRHGRAAVRLSERGPWPTASWVIRQDEQAGLLPTECVLQGGKLLGVGRAIVSLHMPVQTEYALHSGLQWHGHRGQDSFGKVVTSAMTLYTFVRE